LSALPSIETFSRDVFSMFIVRDFLDLFPRSRWVERWDGLKESSKVGAVWLNDDEVALNSKAHTVLWFQAEPLTDLSWDRHLPLLTHAARHVAHEALLGTTLSMGLYQRLDSFT